MIQTSYGAILYARLTCDLYILLLQEVINNKSYDIGASTCAFLFIHWSFMCYLYFDFETGFYGQGWDSALAPLCPLACACIH